MRWGRDMQDRDLAGAVGRVAVGTVEHRMLKAGGIAGEVYVVGKGYRVGMGVAEVEQRSLQGAGKRQVGVERKKHCRRGRSRAGCRKNTWGAFERVAGRAVDSWAVVEDCWGRGNDSCRRSWTSRPGKGDCSWTCCGGEGGTRGERWRSIGVVLTWGKGGGGESGGGGAARELRGDRRQDERVGCGGGSLRLQGKGVTMRIDSKGQGGGRGAL